MEDVWQTEDVTSM